MRDVLTYAAAKSPRCVSRNRASVAAVNYDAHTRTDAMRLADDDVDVDVRVPARPRWFSAGGLIGARRAGKAALSRPRNMRPPGRRSARLEGCASLDDDQVRPRWRSRIRETREKHRSAPKNGSPKAERS